MPAIRVRYVRPLGRLNEWIIIGADGRLWTRDAKALCTVTCLWATFQAYPNTPSIISLATLDDGHSSVSALKILW